MGNYKVRKDTWIEGILHVEEVLFDLLHEAIEHARYEEHHGAKVFDEFDRVVHREGPHGKDPHHKDPETYA